MAGTKGKLKDKNRWRKVYPYIRRKPKYEYCLEKDTIIETGYIEYSNSATGTHTFLMSFPAAPSVVATSFDSEGNNQANVNVFSTTVTATSVVIALSSPFTGRVNFQAIYIDS